MLALWIAGIARLCPNSPEMRTHLAAATHDSGLSIDSSPHNPQPVQNPARLLTTRLAIPVPIGG